MNYFTYQFWFEKCDDGVSWAFTMSGKDEDEKNLDFPELSFVINKTNIRYKDWANSIIKIGVCPDGFMDFHFINGEVSQITAYKGECHDFLKCLELMCLGFLISIKDHDTSIESWINNLYSEEDFIYTKEDQDKLIETLKK